MAMTVSGSQMGIWKVFSDANLRMYQYNMERGRILLQGAAAEQMQREMVKLDAVYDGKKEAEYEAQINATFQKKEEIATTSSRLANALKDIENLRLTLAEMSDAAASGKSELFDAKLSELNITAGSSTGSIENLANLIGNRSRGSWSSSTEIFSASGMDISLKSQFLGSDYQITLNDGSIVSMSSIQGKVGTFHIDSPTDPNSIKNGASVQFTNTETGESHTGTLQMGGLKLGHSWMYGLQDTTALMLKSTQLTTELAALKENSVANADQIVEKQAELDTTKASISFIEDQNKANGKQLAAIVNSAIKTLNKAADEYNAANEITNTAIKNFDISMKDMQRKYDMAAEETLNARNAARKALEAKMKLADTRFALTSTTSATLINGIFSYKNTETEKKSLFSVIGSDQYSAFKNLMGK